MDIEYESCFFTYFTTINYLSIIIFKRKRRVKSSFVHQDRMETFLF